MMGGHPMVGHAEKYVHPPRRSKRTAALDRYRCDQPIRCCDKHPFHVGPLIARMIRVRTVQACAAVAIATKEDLSVVQARSAKRHTESRGPLREELLRKVITLAQNQGDQDYLSPLRLPPPLVLLCLSFHDGDSADLPELAFQT